MPRKDDVTDVVSCRRINNLLGYKTINYGYRTNSFLTQPAPAAMVYTQHLDGHLIVSGPQQIDPNINAPCGVSHNSTKACFKWPAHLLLAGPGAVGLYS